MRGTSLDIRGSAANVLLPGKNAEPGPTIDRRLPALVTTSRGYKAALRYRQRLTRQLARAQTTTEEGTVTRLAVVMATLDYLHRDQLQEMAQAKPDRDVIIVLNRECTRLAHHKGRLEDRLRIAAEAPKTKLSKQEEAKQRMQAKREALRAGRPAA